tara:strand:+ start:1045 stop:1233 length:189 start_codon:yes stop_codon:yes gene_type:complete
MPPTAVDVVVIAAVAGLTHRKTLNPNRAKLEIKTFLPLDIPLSSSSKLDAIPCSMRIGRGHN